MTEGVEVQRKNEVPAFSLVISSKLTLGKSYMNLPFSDYSKKTPVTCLVRIKAASQARIDGKPEKGVKSSSE